MDSAYVNFVFDITACGFDSIRTIKDTKENITMIRLTEMSGTEITLCVCRGMGWDVQTHRSMYNKRYTETII